MPGGGGKGGSSSKVTVNNGPVTVDSDATVTVEGLDDMSVKLSGGDNDKPIKTEGKNEISSDSRVETKNVNDTRNKTELLTDNRNRMSIDLEPVALDTCMTVNGGKLPQGVVRQPYHHHVGMTYFGVEVFGMTFSGHSCTEYDELPKQPPVAWSGAQQHGPVHLRGPRAAGRGGVRVRIK